MRRTSTKVWDLLSPVVEGMGYEFVGAEYVAQGKQSVLRIYIDHPEDGVSVDDCEKVSRQVSAVLDVEDPIPGQYLLEVSSPGLDRPLFTLEQFERFAGRIAKIRLSQPVQGQRNFTVVLQGVSDRNVHFEMDGEPGSVDFDDIDQARLVPDV